MPRPHVTLAALIAPLLIALASAQANAGEVRGKVVQLLCPTWRALEVRCPIRALQTTIDVVMIAVDGQTSRQTVASDRRGRFRLRLSPGYYVVAARPPDLGMSSMPAEFTVASSPVNLTLIITNPVYRAGFDP